MAKIINIDLDKFDELRLYAETHEILIEEAKKIFNKELLPVGDRKEHVLEFENYKFVFSIENTPSKDFEKVYKLRRFSASLNIPNKYPSKELVFMITKQLGFGDLDKCDIRVMPADAVNGRSYILINEIISCS
jgi:hypothetical protein